VGGQPADGVEHVGTQSFSVVDDEQRVGSGLGLDAAEVSLELVEQVGAVDPRRQSELAVERAEEAVDGAGHVAAEADHPEPGVLELLDEAAQGDGLADAGWSRDQSDAPDLEPEQQAVQQLLLGAGVSIATQRSG